MGRVPDLSEQDGPFVTYGERVVGLLLAHDRAGTLSYL